MEQQDASFAHERSVATSRPTLNSPRLARLERPDHAVSVWYRHIVDKGKRIIRSLGMFAGLHDEVAG
jgi:hypothetical protein